MIDFREHKDLIRSTVMEENQKDGNWKWSVKSISAKRVKIRWGYLDYLEEEKNCFEVERMASYDSNRSNLFARTPNGESIGFYCIGNGKYDYTEEKAIECAIHAITGYAHSRY